MPQPQFVSAFRGREIRGTRIAVPADYCGVLFAIDDKDNKKTKQPLPVSKTGRPRRAKKVEEKEDEEDEDTTQQTEPRVLRATSTFDSWMLWNPDNVVDEGRDEYIRGLGEWMNLCAEVRCATGVYI